MERDPSKHLLLTRDSVQKLALPSPAASRSRGMSTVSGFRFEGHRVDRERERERESERASEKQEVSSVTIQQALKRTCRMLAMPRAAETQTIPGDSSPKHAASKARTPAKAPLCRCICLKAPRSKAC